MVRQLYCMSTLLVAAAFLVGCGGGAEDRPDVYPVSGTVLYNNNPVAGATVSFWAEGAARAAQGVTGPDGKFQLSMYDVNDGAIPGVNIITVTKMEAGAAPAAPPPTAQADPSAMMQMMQQQSEGNAAGPSSAIPVKYSDRNTTTLQETVSAEGENSFVLLLTD